MAAMAPDRAARVLRALIDVSPVGFFETLGDHGCQDLGDQTFLEALQAMIELLQSDQSGLLRALLRDYYGQVAVGQNMDDPSYEETRDYDQAMRALQSRAEALLPDLAASDSFEDGLPSLQ